MKRSLWPTRNSVKDYFPLPKEIFSLGLSAAEIAIYAYLLFCEDLQTFKCWPSYRKIGEAVGLSPNTICKHIRSLEERGLLVTEPTQLTTKDGRKRNGNLLFTIRPIQFALQQDYDRQMQKLTEDTPVSAVCAAFRTQSSVYPPETQKPDVAPTCGKIIRPKPNAAGSVERGDAAEWTRPAACGKCGNTPKRAKSRDFGRRGEKAARKQDKAVGSCAPRGGHICPRCGQFRGFTRAFQTQRKTAGGRCGMKKARRFKGNRGVPTKNTR